MKLCVYSVRDNKVGFGTLFVEPNEAAAVRGFSYAVNNPDGMIAFAPADYDLYKIGVFDNEKGDFEPTIPELVCSGSSVFGAVK